MRTDQSCLAFMQRWTWPCGCSFIGLMVQCTAACNARSGNQGELSQVRTVRRSTPKSQAMNGAYGAASFVKAYDSFIAVQPQRPVELCPAFRSSRAKRRSHRLKCYF